MKHVINQRLAIPGDMGFVVKVGLFSGLREDEARYTFTGVPIYELPVVCDTAGHIAWVNYNHFHWLRSYT
jgi:hypothetical protein